MYLIYFPIIPCARGGAPSLPSQMGSTPKAPTGNREIGNARILIITGIVVKGEKYHEEEEEGKRKHPCTA